jgi:hypothetical protein
MSLNWNIEACANYKALTATDEARQLTNRIIWETLCVDVGDLKNEADVRKFVQRSKMLNRCCEFPSDGEPLTVEQVMPYIGLRTNVSTTTDAAFKTKLWNMLLRNTQ